jgi:hypothetical protein
MRLPGQKQGGNRSAESNHQRNRAAYFLRLSSGSFASEARIPRRFIAGSFTVTHSANPKKERPAPLPGALAYTLPDAARLSGLSIATLRRRSAEGLLRLFRVGGRTLVDAATLRRLLGTECK